MVVANYTADTVAERLLDHVDHNVLLLMLEDLKKVPGNKSFRDSIDLIYNVVVEKKKEYDKYVDPDDTDV